MLENLKNPKILIALIAAVVVLLVVAMLTGQELGWVPELLGRLVP